METGVKHTGLLGDQTREIPLHSAQSDASHTEPEQKGDPPENERDFLLMSALLDRSGVLMVILDHQARVRGFSRACEQATGYTFEEVWGKHLWDLLLVPEEEELVKAVFEKLRVGQFPIDYESHWVMKGGSRRLIEWSSTALVDDQDSLQYIIATGVDITERRRAEEALRISEDRYRRLVESAPDAILVHYQGEIVFVNKAGVALLGASSPYQIIGKSVMSFVHPDDRAVVRERLDKILEDGTELPLIEDRLMRLDKTVVQVEADSIFPFMYEGRPAVQVVARRVTGDKQVEAVSSEDNERYEQLFETSIAGTYQATLDGSLLDYNESFAKMLGYESQEEALELNSWQLYADPADGEGFLEQIRDQGTVTNFELRLRRRDGSPVWVLGNATLLDGSDGSASVVQGTLIDITERKRAEEAECVAEQMSEVLMRISTDALTVTDLRGRIRNVSEQALELYGYENADDLIGNSAFELIAPEEHEQAIANLQRAMQEEVVRNAEYSLLRRDGSRFPGEWHTALIRDALGKPRFFVFAARDLADHGRARATMRAPAQDSPDKAGDGSALMEASPAVLGHGEFEVAARTVFESCKTLIGASEGYLALLTEDGAQEKVVLSELGGFSWAADPAQPQALRSLRAQAYRTGKAVYRNELSTSDGTRQTPGAGPTPDNVLFAPLVIEGKAVGLLGLANRPDGFTEDDARTATAFGKLAALALYSNRTAEASEATEARLRSVSEIADHAIITVDSSETTVSWNRGAEVIFGYSADEAVGKRLALPLPEDVRKAYRMAMSHVASGDGFAIVADRAEMVGRRKDGTEFPLELSLVAWKTREDIFLTSSVRDITKRRLAEDAVRLLADHDPLTGLANRVFVTDYLTEALASVERTNQKLAIIIVDLDQFLEINHRLGLTIGNRLLQRVGDRLTQLVRAGDTVARWGDDAFILLLPGITETEHANKIAEKVLLALREPYQIDGHESRVTASVGLALYPDDGEEIDDLVRNAELAICGVKNRGGDDFQRPDTATEAEDQYGVVHVI